MESNKQTRIAMAHDAKVLSYAAAYLEADGGISIQIQGPHKRATNLRISISSIDEDIILWFQEVFGGYVRRSKANRKKRYRASYNWSVVSRQAYAFLKAIRPYMRVGRKKEVADLAIEFVRGKASPHEIAIHNRNAEWLNRYVQRNFDYRNRIVSLNSKGIRIDRDPLKRVLQVEREISRNEPKGEQNHGSKLSERKVKDIRTRYGNGGKVTLKRLADEYGVCEATIFNVVRRRNWRHVK